MKILLEGKMADETARHIVDYAHKGIKKRMMLDTKRTKLGSGWLVEMHRRVADFNDAEKVMLMTAIFRECAAIDVTAEEVE